MDKMMLDVVGSIYLLLGWHLVHLFSWLLSIAIVCLEDSVIQWNLELEAVLHSPTVLGAIEPHWGSVRYDVSWIEFFC